jgi:hypothetical protein
MRWYLNICSVAFLTVGISPGARSFLYTSAFLDILIVGIRTLALTIPVSPLTLPILRLERVSVKEQQIKKQRNT